MDNIVKYVRNRTNLSPSGTENIIYSNLDDSADLSRSSVNLEANISDQSHNHSTGNRSNQSNDSESILFKF
jgi:hypothetical protein